MTTAPGSWHLDSALVRRYVDAATDAVTAASVEAHLLRCAECRRSIAAGTVDSASVARRSAIWTDVVDRLDAPRVGLLERVLRRIGVRDGDARLLAATPSLQLSWLASLLLALGFAVAAARGRDTAGALFLLVAPLLPVAGVAAAYGADVDPAYELSMAAPYRATRLLLLRSVSVLVASLGLAGAAALALPASGWSQAAWLLPALGLSVTTLALSTRLSPALAAAGVSLTWVSVVVRLLQLDRTADIAGASTQLSFLVLIVAATAVLAVRRDQFDTRSAA
ncbi:MAG TPA: hypothetical protein VNB94_01240 [Mycobacteriales bacterium]|nr:hypothetical protein [Mycobacteriales bacterium]